MINKRTLNVMIVFMLLWFLILFNFTLKPFIVIPENLFGTYYEKGDLIDRRNMESVEDPDDPLTNANRYVLADITSFFTLLVGIYFPSVTGDALSNSLYNST